MSCRLSREHYELLVKQDTQALRDAGAHLPMLERQHIEQVLEDSVKMHYEFLPAVARILSNKCKDGDVELVEKVILDNMRDRC